MRIRGLAVLVTIHLAACGGDDDGAEPTPLVDGSVDGEYAGESFTATFGFATILTDDDSPATAPIIGFGDEGIGCGDETATDPPPGHSAVIALDIDDFAVGEYGSQFVMIYTNVDEFEGVGAGGASVSLTEVTDASVAGSVDWSYTDDEARTFGLSGTFEAVRCPQ